MYEGGFVVVAIGTWLYDGVTPKQIELLRRPGSPGFITTTSISESGPASSRAWEPNRYSAATPKARKAGSVVFNLEMASSRRMSSI